ncbi:hypothetical protein HHJ39_00005 [Escherichia coli]|nr:hypothetical protein HHJ39_00005 [Escherichia coli]
MSALNQFSSIRPAEGDRRLTADQNLSSKFLRNRAEKIDAFFRRAKWVWSLAASMEITHKGSHFLLFQDAEGFGMKS